MTPRLNDMALFAAVVREGNFTAAGRALGITKQSVSERVAKLEASVGVRLLARSTRTMQLTEPGERFHQACVEVVSLAEEAARAARRADSEPSGLLRVAAPEVLGHELLLAAVAELRCSHPGVLFELALSDQSVDIIKDGFDLAIRLGDLPKGLSSRKLGQAKRLFVASPELLEAQGSPRNLADLGSIAFVGRARVERWSLARRTVTVEPAVVVSTHEGLRRAACLGLGVARVAHALVNDDLRSGRLRALFDGRPALQGPVHAVWRTGSLVPRRLELFLDVLVHRAKEWAPLAG